MENYTDTILSQYANSPTITSLIETFNDAIDPAVDLDNVFSYIWDVDTAQGFGLDILGKIVNISRLLTVNATPQYFGFSQATSNPSQPTDPAPFGQVPFYSGVQSTNTLTLTDDAYRKLIIAKAMANITNCTVPNINKILQWLFSNRGTAYVVDVGNMQLRYVFNFNITPFEQAVVTSSGVLPRSAGVLANALEIIPPTTFGFAGTGLQPFGQGNFFNSTTGFIDAI